MPHNRDMNEREYLVSKGLAKPGRGRFSTAAKAELARARAAGIKIGASTEPSEKVIVEIPAMTWPNHRAVTKGGEEISMKNACFTCSVSLSWCECGNPRALARTGGYQEVRIVPIQ